MRPALPHLESVNLVGKTLVYYEILESLGDGGTRGGRRPAFISMDEHQNRDVARFHCIEN